MESKMGESEKKNRKEKKQILSRPSLKPRRTSLEVLNGSVRLRVPTDSIDNSPPRFRA